MLVSVEGRERSDSVRNGLEDIGELARIIAVHDAARPLVSDALIDRVINEARKDTAPRLVCRSSTRSSVR